MKYQEILNIFKPEIEKIQKGLTCGIDFNNELEQKLISFLNAPSKHIRPLVSFLYLKMAGFDIDDNQIKYQTAIELVHNASLIHDDIIDGSETRRGQVSINKEFGNKLAVISGDYLLAQALKTVNNLKFPNLVELFADTMKTMTGGEINQYFDKYNIPTLEQYIKKSENKTAKLFETAVCGSLIIAGSNDIKSGKEFAKNFGTAFQIRDDLINHKTTQTDLNNGIYTAPVIFSGKIQTSQDGIEKTQDLLNNYIEKALNNIEHFKNSSYKESVADFLQNLREE